MVNDLGFERKAFDFLKTKFDKVEWKSRISMAPIDFYCYMGNTLFKIEAKSTKGEKIRLLPSQKDIDAIVFNKKDGIKLIWKKDFKDLVIYDKMSLIKVSEETKTKLDDLKKHKRETYNDVVSLLISKQDRI